MNRLPCQGVVWGPTGPIPAGPECFWDAYNQMYTIRDGKLIRQNNDPYYDYYMYLMQQNLQSNNATGGCPPPISIPPQIPGRPKHTGQQVIERGMARESDTTLEQGHSSDPQCFAKKRQTGVTPGTNWNSNSTEPRGASQISTSHKEAEMFRQAQTREKSAGTRDPETASSNSEIDQTLIGNGRKLVTVETALDFLNASPRLTLSKLANADDSGKGTVITRSLSELSRALKTSSRRTELDKVIPKFPVHGISTATVKSLAKRLSKISKGDAKNATRPELFVLSSKASGKGKKGGKEKAGEEVGGKENDAERGYFLFRLHSSDDEAEETTTTTATTTTASTNTTKTSTGTSSSDSSSSSSTSDDYSDDRRNRYRKKRRRGKYQTTEDSSEYDDEYDDYSDTDYYDDYDYNYDYSSYDYDYDDDDYDYGYEDYSESSSPWMLPRPRKGQIVHTSSSETPALGPARHNRPSRSRVKQQPRVQRVAATAVPLVHPTTETAAVPAVIGSNQNANNYLKRPVDLQSGREASPAADYADSQEATTADQTPDISCVAEAKLAKHEIKKELFKEDDNGGSRAPEKREDLTYNDRRQTGSPICDPQDDRRMTHDPFCDTRDDGGMTQTAAYNYTQEWLRSGVNVAKTANLFGDPHAYEEYDMQRNQNANKGTVDEEEAFAIEKEEGAKKMGEKEEGQGVMMKMSEESDAVNASRSADLSNPRKMTEFVEILAKAIAFPDGKYEIVDVDVVPLKPRRSGSFGLKVKASTSRTGRTRRTGGRTQSSSSIPKTPSNVEVATTQLPISPSPNHPQHHQTPFPAIQQTAVASKINDVTLKATMNEVNRQTTLSDRVSDVLHRTNTDDVRRISDLPRQTTSATQTDVTTEEDDRSAGALADELRKVTETALSCVERKGVTMRRDSGTQTVVTQTNDGVGDEVTGAGPVPCRSPLFHRNPLNLSSNCSPASLRPPPSPHHPSPSSSLSLRLTRDQIMQTERLDQDPFSSHLVKYGNFVYSLYQQDQLTDVILKAETECFYAHRSVLACHSLYFASVFTQDPVSSFSSSLSGPLSSRPTPDILEINDVSPAILRKILEYIYTGQISLHQSFLLDVLMAANKLGIAPLESICIKKLNALHPHELLDVMISAYKQGMEASDLIDKLWHRIACHFKTVIRTKQFLQMNVDCICRLLLDDDLVLTSEIDVAQAAIRWINDDREQRIPVAGRVLSCVRFKNLTPDELVSLDRLEAYILNDPVVKNAILEASWYHTCQLRRTDTGMTSLRHPHIRQKTELRAQGYKAELPTHPFFIPYENWRN